MSDFQLRQYYSAPYRRPSLQFDPSPGVHTLLGPRRVGKTTQFKLWIEALKKQTPELVIQFLDAERFDTWKDLLPILEGLGRVQYLFIDEITAVKDWPRAIKVMWDSGQFDQTCVWLTGSNAFDLKTSGERLPGRRGQGMTLRDAELLPLTYREFHDALVLHRRVNLGEYKKSFDLFLQWGGYPMSVSECLTRETPSEDLLQELLDVVLGETSRKHRSPRLSAALAERLWLSLGSKISYNALAKHMDAGSHPIIRQYIEILEDCYALLQCERLNKKTGTGVLRKDKKIYFLDPLPMAALVSWSATGKVDSTWAQRQLADPVRQGGWIESVIASELRKREVPLFYDEAYGGEIDFVLPRSEKTGRPTALEIKRSAPSQAEVKHVFAEYPRAQVWVYLEKLPEALYSLA